MSNQLREATITADEVFPQSPETNHWKLDPEAAELLKNNSETVQNAAKTDFAQNNSKTNQTAAEAELPQDLITEILLSSSVKTLWHFRCVSKAFCTIIDSEQFKYLHQNRYAKNKEQRKLIRIKRNCSDRSLHVNDVDTGLLDTFKMPYSRSALAYGYCNGLVLLFADSSKLAVWNPTTHHYRNLPRCPIKTPEGSHCSRIGMGLGYDSTRHEYKVVLIVGTKTNYDVHDLRIWIFGLKSNSWRMSTQDFPYTKHGNTHFGHFANGSLHWLCNYGSYIVAFDLAKETISEVSQPLFPSKIARHRSNLQVLDGCLCMSFFLLTVPREVSFYVKEEVGTKFQWRKLFSVTHKMSRFFSVTKILGCSKEGDKIWLDQGFNVTVIYDLKRRCFATETIKLVDDDAKRPWSYVFPFLCLESFASVGNGDIMRISGQKRKNQEP